MRFPGFTDEWKTDKLSSYAKKIIKKNKGNSITNVLCNSANLGIIPQSEYFDRDIANSENTDTYYVIECGDFVYNPRKSVTAPYGPVNLYDRPESGIISPLYLCFRIKNISKDFLLRWFKGNSWHKYVYSHGDTGVRYDRVSIKDEIFLNMPILLPSIPEQEKIAKFLSLLDERIATQNKIIEDLKKLKSAIIDNHLSRVQTDESGKTVKLGEIGNFTRGLTYSADDTVEDGGIVVVRANNLSNGEAVNLYNEEIVRVDKSISGSQQLKDGDIVICMANGSSALVGKASYYNDTTDSIVTVGAFCGIYRSNKKIVRWLLQTNKYKRATHKSLQGGNGAIANLTPNDILGLSFIIPKHETLIVELLQEFDVKLDIEMSLLHNLQKEKQYLLSQMFI